MCDSRSSPEAMSAVGDGFRARFEVIPAVTDALKEKIRPTGCVAGSTVRTWDSNLCGPKGVRSTTTLTTRQSS